MSKSPVYTIEGRRADAIIRPGRTPQRAAVRCTLTMPHPRLDSCWNLCVLASVLDEQAEVAERLL
jgi:hypothetical protein